MTNPLKTTLLSATLMALMLPAAAQTTTAQPGTAPTQTAPSQPTSPVPPNSAESIQQHRENQKDRIANGIANGSLTTKESGQLEKQESNLNQEESNMRKEDNGHLTTADKAALRQQQNQLSNQIYKDKHNAASEKMNMTGKVGQTQDQQQQRIANGVKNGQLDAAQTSNLENKENSLDREVAQDRKANGGHLTQQEKNQVKAQQNKLSKQIYKDKHSNPSPRH
jgi:hypothetical protein